MSTTIQVPANVIFLLLPGAIDRAQGAFDFDKERYDIVVNDESIDRAGFVYVVAMQDFYRSRKLLSHLKALNMACKNGWPINLGSDDFYLLDNK